ncbi:MAG: DOMON domain-containing protein [Candidatus Kariarchaeaceae archaeon]|jgi:hypothetical protein
MLLKKLGKIGSMLLLLCLLVVGTQIASTRNINFQIAQAPVIDGVITPGEYNSLKSFSSGDYKLYWEVVDDTSISIGIVAKTTGWVALGIDPTSQMQDADIIYGWVEPNGTVVIYDAFSLNPTGANHPADTTLGGTNDILSYNGSENTTSTTIEFTRLLSTDDLDNDNNIPVNGDVDIIWAYGADDSFSSYHSARGTSVLTIAANQETTTTTSDLSTTTSESTPGFQGFLLLFGLFSLVFIYRKKS